MAILKKSGFEDTIFFIAVIFAAVITILILNYTWNQIKNPLDTGISASIPNNSAINITNTLNKVTTTASMFDKLLPFLIIGLFAFVFIGAAAYMNHPIMIFVGLIVLSVTILLASIYANVYHQISSSDEMSSTNSSLPITELFMKYLPYILIILFIVITAAVIWSRGGSSTL